MGRTEDKGRMCLVPPKAQIAAPWGMGLLRPPVCAQGPGQATHPCWAINQPLVKEREDGVGRGCLRRKKIGKRGEKKRKEK